MKPIANSLFTSRLTPTHSAMVLTMCLLASPLATADNGWWNTTDGNWSNTANWWTTAAGNSNVAAVPTTAQTATFNGTGINGNQTVYLDGARSVSSLTFSNTGTTTLLGGTSGSPASNALTLSGASGITVNAGAGAVTVGSTSAAVPIVLGVNQTWTNNSSNLLTIANPISGNFTLVLAGPGATLLQGANTHSQNTTVTGTVRVGVDSVGTAAAFSSGAFGAGGGTVVRLFMNGGTVSSDSTTGRSILNYLAFGGNATFGDSVMNGKLTFGNGGTLGNAQRTFTVKSEMEIMGDVAGTGAGGIIKAGASTLTLSGPNSYTGGTTAGAGTLVLDYATQDNTKLSNTSALTFSGGTLTLRGGTHTEIVSATTLSAGAAANVNRSSGSAVLQMNAITRNTASTINFGAANLASTDALNTNGILGPWATVAGTDWAYNSGSTTVGGADASQPTGAADGFIRSYTGYTDVPRLTPGTIADGSTTNVRLTQGSGSPGNITLGSATTTINTLVQSASGGSGSATIDTASSTLGVTGILAASGSGALTIGTSPGSGTLRSATAGGELLIHNHSSNALTINAVIANNSTASSLTHTGSGTTVIAGANTYTGTTTINEGTLRFNNASAAIGLLTLNGGTLDLASDMKIGSGITGGNGLIANAGIGGTITSSGGRLLLAGGSAVGNGPDWGPGAGRTITIEAVMHDGGLYNNMDYFGIGTFVVKGANTYTGTSGFFNTIVEVGVNSVGSVGSITSGPFGTGTLQFGSGTNSMSGGITSDGTTARTILNGFNFGQSATFGSTTNTGKLTFAADGSLGNANRTLNVHSVVEFSGAIAGGGATGALTKAGLSTLILSGGNGYTGATTISAGTLQLGNGGTTGSLSTSSAITNNANLTINRSNAVSQGTDFSGAAISGTGSFTQAGAGTTTLTAANDYTGATFISGGTLALSGSGTINTTTSLSIASGTTFRYNSSVAYSGGTINNNGGTISGTGTIGVAVTLNSTGDKLAPGNSPGVQNYSVSQTWNSFTYEWETNNFTGTTAGTDFDQIAIAGSLDLTGGSGSYVLDLISLNGSNIAGNVPNFSETNRSWNILTATGGITGFNSANWAIDTTGLTAFTSSPAWGGTWSLSLNDTLGTDSLVLNYAAVPEPAAAFIGSLGLLALLRRRRN